MIIYLANASVTVLLKNNPSEDGLFFSFPQRVYNKMYYNFIDGRNVSIGKKAGRSDHTV